jgi:protein CpxP
MKRGTLTLVIAGFTLALALPPVTAVSAPVTGNDGFQVALDDGQPVPPPPGPDATLPGPGMTGHGWHKEGGWDPQEGFKHRCEIGEAHQAAILAYAEVRLQLTDAQKPAWAKFVEAAKAARAPQAKLCVDLADKPRPATLPERLARIEQVTSARLAQLQAFRPAVEELYQQLTPEQRNLADRLVRPGGGGHHHHSD